MPILQNLGNGGQSCRDNGISFDRVVRRVEEPIERGCPALWVSLERELVAARQRGLFGAP